MIRRLGRTYVKGWTRTFDYSGRSTRFEFYTFILANWVLEIGYIAATLTYGAMANELSEPVVLGLFTGWFAIALVTGVPNVSATVRRLRDTGRSGWLACIVLIPILGRLALSWFLRQPTKQDV